MRVLLVSIVGEGLWFAWLLGQRGHRVECVVKHDEYQNVLSGLVSRVAEPSSPDKYDLCFFDLTGEGKLADACRLETPTIGGSTLADTLEFDRIAGIEYMQKCGIAVPAWQAFSNPADALRLIRKTKKRYVYKACGKAASCSTSYVSKSAEDLEGYIAQLFAQTPSKEFILQEFVAGTECSTECWINQTGYYAVNHTLEEKKQLAGNLGPNVGCSGNLCWMPERETTLFRQGLRRAIPRLMEDEYTGMIDLNTIVTESTVYGLEWTPRVGYEGLNNLTQLLPMEFGAFLHTIASHQVPPPLLPTHAFSASIRLSIPPYPFEATPRQFKANVPIDGLTEKMLPGFFLYDARLLPDTEKFVTAGCSGWIGAPMGYGETIGGAFDAVMEKIHRVRVPDLCYRNDVPRSVAHRYQELESNGWLRAQIGN